MFKVIFLYPRPSDPEAFKRQYVERHLPLCKAIPNSGRASYSFEPQAPSGTSEWFCIFEIEFDDRQQWQLSMMSPEAQAAQQDASTLPVQPIILFFEPQKV